MGIVGLILLVVIGAAIIGAVFGMDALTDLVAGIVGKVLDFLDEVSQKVSALFVFSDILIK